MFYIARPTSSVLNKLTGSISWNRQRLLTTEEHELIHHEPLHLKDWRYRFVGMGVNSPRAIPLSRASPQSPQDAHIHLCLPRSSAEGSHFYQHMQLIAINLNLHLLQITSGLSPVPQESISVQHSFLNHKLASQKAIHTSISLTDNCIL